MQAGAFTLGVQVHRLAVSNNPDDAGFTECDQILPLIPELLVAVPAEQDFIANLYSHWNPDWRVGLGPVSGPDGHNEAAERCFLRLFILGQDDATLGFRLFLLDLLDDDFVFHWFEVQNILLGYCKTEVVMLL